MSSNLLEYLYQALNETHGVEIISSDRHHTRQQLYAARREAMDPQLNALAVVFSPTEDDRLWIIKT